MGRFVNDQTGAVVSVDDSKDDRFTQGWTAQAAPKPAAKKSAESSRSPKS